jgi:hypothetical protein
MNKADLEDKYSKIIYNSLINDLNSLKLHLFDIDDCVMTTGAKDLDSDAVILFDTILKNSNFDLGICSTSPAVFSLPEKNFLANIKGHFGSFGLTQEEKNKIPEKYRNLFDEDFNKMPSNDKSEFITKHYLYQKYVNGCTAEIKIFYYDNDVENLRQVNKNKFIDGIEVTTIPMSSMPIENSKKPRQSIVGTVTTKDLCDKIMNMIVDKKPSVSNIVPKPNNNVGTKKKVTFDDKQQNDDDDVFVYVPKPRKKAPTSSLLQIKYQPNNTAQDNNKDISSNTKLVSEQYKFDKDSYLKDKYKGLDPKYKKDNFALKSFYNDQKELNNLPKYTKEGSSKVYQSLLKKAKNVRYGVTAYKEQLDNFLSSILTTEQLLSTEKSNNNKHVVR